MDMDTEGSILGNAVLRREDPALLQGADAYFDDIAADGVAYVQFVRSTVAHARLTEVDINAAETMPGVIGVYTAENTSLPPLAGMGPPELAQSVFATGRVRFVGEVIAAIVAKTRAQAVDASEMVFVDYDELDVILDGDSALSDGAELLFPEHGTNECFRTSLGEGDPVAGSAHVIELTVDSQRLAAVPIEANGTLAIPDGSHLMVWIPSQNPISIAGTLADSLGMEVGDDLRVGAPPGVGGGFGAKAGLAPETVVTAGLARELARPVKWTESRSENMVAMTQGRDMKLAAKLGVDDEGRFTGLDVKVIADVGAYPAVGAILPTFTEMMVQGVYDIPAVRFDAQSALTNKTPIAAYRGAGRPEATQLLERLVDVAAAEVGLDPVELRRRNFIAPDRFPLTVHSGQVYDNGEYAMVLDAALDAAGYDGLRAEQATRYESGSTRQLGIGISTYVEVTAPAGLHVEYGAVEFTGEGRVIARVGTSAHGQGHVTAFSMIISDVLGVPMDDITVLQSDTVDVPRGAGTMGSRSLQTAGSAVHVASETVLEKAKQLAAHLLEASVDDVVVAHGELHVAGVPTRAMTWAELVAASNDDNRRPPDMEPGLAHELDFDGTNATYPFGAHVAVVEVDTETGGIELLRHVAVDDAGRILNPLLVTGQQHGGIAQGIAQALFEAVQYDDFGNPVTTNLADYAVPAASEFPAFETHNTETPTFRNPLGAKGIGESGTIGSTPAIHNAVLDALAPYDIRHLDMPLTPHKVWAALNS